MTTRIHRDTPTELVLDNGGDEFVKFTREGDAVIADAHREVVIDEEKRLHLITWLQRPAPKAGVAR